MVRKRVEVDMPRVYQMIADGWSLQHICNDLKVTRKTLSRRLKEQNTSPKQVNAGISDEVLLKAIESIVLEFPNIGYRQLWCALRTRNVMVPRARVYDMLHVVDPSGVYARARNVAKIPRIKYCVPHAHYIWHIDTNLKLGPWKIVIRGAVDGYSRTVVYLEAGTSNTATDQLQAFMKAVNEYTIPYRTRTDKGGENRDIATFMLLNRGVGIKAHICGSSVHNVRIERFWLDLNVQVVRLIRGYFHNLEQKQVLDRTNSTHLSVLHHIYIPFLQNKLEDYRRIYNAHKLRTENLKSPTQMLSIKPMPQEKVITTVIPLIPTEVVQIGTLTSELERFTEVKPFNQISIDPKITNLVAATLVTLNFRLEKGTEMELQKAFEIVRDVVNQVQQTVNYID